MNFLRTAVNVTAVNEKFCQKAMWRPALADRASSFD